MSGEPSHQGGEVVAGEAPVEGLGDLVVDTTAVRIVEAGGGMEAVIEATGVRTRENVLRLIDPAILERARQNDAARAAAGDSAK